jgi:hypothetical protein
MLLKNKVKLILGNAPILLHFGLAAALCLATGACVTSSDPILDEAKAILGVRGELHIFTAPKDGVRQVRRYRFNWNGKRYRVTQGRGRRVGEFTAHAFEGRDLVVQWKGPALGSKKKALTIAQVRYALARRVAEGTYLFVPITEDDVDEATRKRFCTASPETPCRISTPEQLFVFARAAAERDDQDAGVAIIVPQHAPGKRR